MTALPATITKKALKTADRNELADYYAHCRAMGNAWIRKQVLEYNRIDILAVVVLGLKVQPFHLALQQFQFRHPDNLQLVFRGAGKCHAKGTLVLMHNGERKAVEDVVVGDKLMGPDSLPRCVLSTHSGYGPLYRITPVKGESFVCNGVHEIPLVGVGQQGHYSGKRRVFTPPEAAAAISKLKNPKDWQWKLEKSQAVEFCGLGSGLPFDPYLFGLWLGDGDAAGTRITNQEPEIRAWIKGWAGKHGYLVNDQPGYVDLSTPGSGPYCPNPFLDFVRSTEDKHIPHAYLVASREDRLRLLAGLLDTDGWYSEHSNYFEISQKRPWLAEQIAFLARSLGFASYVTKTKAKIKSTGFEGDAWTQNIVGNVSDIPTIVSRKRARPQARCKDVSKVGIKRIESVGDGDWHGFEVDRDHLFLRADFTVDHNSTTCTVTRAIFLLLKDPLLRILIASKTAQNAEGFLTEIKNHFENNELLQEIFGAYYDPRKCPKWDNREIIVLPRTVSKEARARNKEASITCVGVEGTIVSKHYDAIISDDLVDEENSRTQYMRDKAKTWYYQTLLPTLEPPESEIEHRGEHHRLGTRYHYADLYGHLIENELKDHHQVIPALDEHGRSPWPEKYPAKWFTKRRRESGIIIFNAQYQCHSEDTEFLTRDGWKRAEQVGKSKLATVNVETGALEYQAPTGRTRLPYSGDLLRVRSHTLDALVTPNHRMVARPAGWTKRTSPPQGPWGFVEASDIGGLAKDRTLLYSGATWTGRERASFEIPEGRGGRADGRGGVRAHHPAMRVSMDVFLKFIGYFVSEGSTTEVGRGGVRLGQNEGPTLESMKACCREMGLEYKESGAPGACKSVDVRHIGLWTWLRKNVKTSSKDAKIPRFVFELSARQQRIVFGAMVEGDGHVVKLANGGESYQYTTTSRTLADNFQELSLLLCMDASLSEDRNVFSVIARKAIGNGVKPEQITPESYDGDVVCFQVPNGTLITRLNGKAIVSGNCDTEAMKGEIFSYDLCQQVSPEDYPSHKGLRVYMGVDLAISEKDSADKFAIVVIGMVPDRSGYFALDYYEGQLRFKAQTAKIVEYYRRWDPIRCMIETNQYQEAQYQTLKDEYPDIRLKAVKQDKDKITRAWKLSGAFEDGKMYFRKGQHDLLIEHIVLFPNHRYKDLFDAFDLAMRGSRVKRKRSREREPGVI